MDTIRIYRKDEDAYKMLEKACMILNATSATGTTFTVGETYFDFGQDWKWTTILAVSPKYGHYQALSPRAHEDIIFSTDLLKTIAEIKTDKFWLDK